MRLGLVGLFDMGDFAGAAVRRVVESGLARRLPDAEILVLTCLGSAHPTVRDSGDAPRIVAEAGALDAVVAAGALPEDDAPLRALFQGLSALRAWTAATVAPGGSAEVPAGLLHASASDPATAEALGLPLVPHPATGLVAALDAGGLRRRCETLRLVGRVPDASRLVLVDAAVLAEPGGQAALASLAGQDLALALVDVSTARPEERGPLHAAAAALPRPTTALDTGCPIEDVAAVLSAAAAVVSGTPALTAAAHGAGVPVAVASPDELVAAVLDAIAVRRDPVPLLRALDAELDALAAALSAAVPAPPAATRRRPGAAELERRLAMASALAEDRARQMATLRIALEAEIAALRAEREQQDAAHAERVRALEAEVARRRAEVDRILGSKTWRWSEPARSAVRRLRALAERRR